MAVLSTPFQYITSIPPVTRAFTAATVICSSVYYYLRWRGLETPFLTLIPGSSVFYPWTFVTAGLVEATVIELLVTLVFIPASLRYFERLWGAIETLKFIVISLAVPNLISFVFNWIEFVVTRNADLFLYGMQYHGQMALQTAILVAFTQVIPEHQVQILSVIKARVKRLPMAYVTLSTVLTFVGLQCPYILIQFGWLVAWVYLRFYKRNSSDVVGGGVSYGDQSETFAFVQWFPPFLHQPIGMATNVAHSLALRLHIIPSPGNDLESGAYAPLPGGARAEAERRRAMALKALDQRLANSSAQSSQSQGDSSRAQPSRPTPGPMNGSSSTVSSTLDDGEEEDISAGKVAAKQESR